MNACLDFLVRLAAAMWVTWRDMAPYLLLGFLVAGVLSVCVSAEQVARHLGGRGARPVFKAALLGVPLPLCSCGVIPVAASLRRHGASRGATTAFLISTPQTGVDSIAATYSLLGGALAAIRPLAALLSGLAGGWLTDRLAEPGQEPDAGPPPACREPCCAAGSGAGGRLARALRFGFVDLPREIGGPLLAGVLAAGLIAALVPDHFFSGLLGAGWASRLVMLAIGIPLYVCATGSVPIAAALIAKGVSPGAALVFLMTGPATNAATLAIVWKVLGRRTAAVYLLTVAGAALGFGWLLDRLAQAGLPVVAGTAAGHAMPPGWLSTAAAAALLAALAWSFLDRRIRR